MTQQSLTLEQQFQLNQQTPATIFEGGFLDLHIQASRKSSYEINLFAKEKSVLENQNNIFQEEDFLMDHLENMFQKNTQNMEINNPDFLQKQISQKPLDSVNDYFVKEEKLEFDSRSPEAELEYFTDSKLNPFTLDQTFQNCVQPPKEKLKKQQIKKVTKKISKNAPFKINDVRKANERMPKIKKNYDKNICRYLTRKTIRCFAHQEYRTKVMEFCNNDQELYMRSTEFFVRRIERITGFRILKEYLNVQEEQDLDTKDCKIVFKRFYKWFLKERIARYIMKGEMEDKTIYIKYKNEVMLKYVDSLEDWTSNKNKKMTKI